MDMDMCRAEQEEKWKKAGLCPQCGIVVTHKILLGGKVKLAQTNPGKTYKGYCLRCNSMTQIRLILKEPGDVNFKQEREAYRQGEEALLCEPKVDQNQVPLAVGPRRGDMLDDISLVSDVTLDPSIMTRPALSNHIRKNENEWSLGKITEDPGNADINNCQPQGPSPGQTHAQNHTHLAGVKLFYGITGSGGFRWARIIRGNVDLKFGWERLGGTNTSTLNPRSHMDVAYARNVEFWEGEEDDNGVCLGQVSLVGIEDSMVECECTNNGHVVVNLLDIERAQKMNQQEKIKWFQNACSQLYSVNEEPVRIKVRHKHMLEDSLEAVMSLSQTDLKKRWAPEREEEIGELKSQEWYKSIIEQLFCSDAGLWQKCSTDETRMEINFISEMLCPDHLKYFRFVGRILGKAFVDRQLVRCRLAKHLYKLLLGWPIVLDDLKDLDSGTHSYLRSLEEAGEDVANLGLHFTVSEDLLGLRTRVPLVPNGFEFAVVEENFPEYVDSCFKYYVFTRCAAQLNAFILGFFDIVPESPLAIFDFQELEALMCGSYTGGKTEEVELNDEAHKQQLERPEIPFEEEVVYNIFNEPVVVKKRAKTSAPNSDHTPTTSQFGTTSDADFWALARAHYADEEKVEENSSDDFNYPTLSIPSLAMQSNNGEGKSLEAHAELNSHDASKKPQDTTGYASGSRSDLRLPNIPNVPDDLSVLTHDTHFLPDHTSTSAIRSNPQQTKSNLPAKSGANSEKKQGQNLLPAAPGAFAGLQPPQSVASTSSPRQNSNLPAISENNSESQSPPSSEPALPEIEAYRVEDHDSTVYEAVRVDSSSELASKERSLLIKRGSCPTCSLQTHRVSGLFKKSYKPLTNEHVLSGRCLICNPITPQPRQRTESNSPSVNDSSSSGSESNEMPGVQESIDGSEVSRSESNAPKPTANSPSPSETEEEKVQDVDSPLDGALEERMQQKIEESTTSAEGKAVEALEESDKRDSIGKKEGHSKEVYDVRNNKSDSNSERLTGQKAPPSEPEASDNNLDTPGHLAATINSSPSLDSDRNNSKSSIEPAGANLATVTTTNSNSKAVRCGHCSTSLFMVEAGTSFLCEKCSKVSHLDGAKSVSSLENRSCARKQEVDSAKSNDNDRDHYIIKAEESRAKGDTAFLKANLSEAVGWYNSAIELNSEDHQSFSNLSATYLRMGDAVSTLKALKCAREILRIKVDGRQGEYNRGYALLLLQRYEDAMLVFESALFKYPDDPALTFGLSDAIESILSSSGGPYVASQDESSFPELAALSDSQDTLKDGNDQDLVSPTNENNQLLPTACPGKDRLVWPLPVELKQGGSKMHDITPAVSKQVTSCFPGAATYDIPASRPFRLIIARGSVVSFVYPPNPQRAAIVNCANEAGVNNAICEAGGSGLWKDRQSLPVATCSEGSAFVTFCSDFYGKLQVPYVIHAVGPNYIGNNVSHCDNLLSSAYISSLECSKKNHIEAIAFSLLSADHNRGERSLNEVLRIGMESICTFDGYPELKEVYLFASTRTKMDALMKIAMQIDLIQEQSQSASINTPGKSSQDDLAVPKAEQMGDELPSDLREHAFLPAANDFNSDGNENMHLGPSSKELTNEPKDLTAGKSEEQLPCDSEAIDENLDMLGRLVNLAAAHLNLHFDPSTSETNLVPRELHLCNTVHPVSGLTLGSYFRRDDASVAASALLSKSTPEIPSDGLNEFDNIRLQINERVECMISEPVQLPPKYVELIKSDKVLGRGYFGEVRLGIDASIGKKFAIKLIKPLVIEQALADRLESIQKSFQNEIKILTQLRHPNIAPLYGYCMEEGRGLQNTCLLYELAINGSLDNFWNNENNPNELQRERLSDAKIRAKIALEVATVLRHMHEGLDGGAKCFHRDIKSANICLMADFSARVIDCGLAKYVTEEAGSFSSAGPTGTPGYTCPQYLQGEISFESACDVFSFGVVVCELITGKISCRRAQHYSTYKKKSKSGRRLEDDADPCVDWGSGLCLKKLSTLAYKCLRFSSERRPSIGRVVKELQNIVNCHSDSHGRGCDIDDYLGVSRSINRKSSEDTGDSLKRKVDGSQRKCRLCGEVSTTYIQCSGDQHHVHCHNCLESHLQRNINRFCYGGLTCLKDGCNSKRFCDEEVSSLVSQGTWDSYSNQRNSNLFQLMGKNLMDQVEENFRQMQDLIIQLSAGNGLPCPKLFILVEADSQGKPVFLRNPKEWAKNAGSVKLYLYFVCSHSLQPVSDNCRIKVRYRRDWLKAISPALKVSIALIKISMAVLLGREMPLDSAKIDEMDEWAKGLLEPTDRDAIEEASNSGCRDMNADLHTLVGNSLSRVAEKAASSNINWQSELVPVYDYGKNEATFVMEKYASDHRYQKETDIFYSP